MFKYFTLLIVVLMWALTIGYTHLTRQHEMTLYEVQVLTEYCNMKGGDMIYGMHPNGHVSVTCEGGLPAE
jgi:hypothetical protein